MLVPAGVFWRGCNAQIGDRCEDDPEEYVLLNVPYREIELSEFWIDKCEPQRCKRGRPYRGLTEAQAA